MSGGNDHHNGFHGPKSWALSAVAGVAIGLVLAFVAPAHYADHSAGHDTHASSGDEQHGAHEGDQGSEHAADGQGLEESFSEFSLPEPLVFADASDEHFPPLFPGAADQDGDQDDEQDEAAPGETDDAQNGHQDGHATSPGHGAEHAELGDNGESPSGHGDEHASGHADGHDDGHDDGHAGHDDHAEGGHHDDHGPSPVIPVWLVVPFALLLLSIAVMPFINERFWHAHYPDFAFLLGALMIAYYLFAFNAPDYHHGHSYGQYTMIHTGLEYYSFIALIGGLYVASGGVLVDVKGKGRPMLNTAILGIGAVMANIMGTTGASVLLIRPFMRINKGRLKPIHIVMFIFIVSNCGGALTPIGDPPLYLGYLKGVPFQWTILHLWPMWAVCIGMLLAMFFAIDTFIGKGKNAEPADASEGAYAVPEKTSVSIRGTSGMIALGLIIAGVFIDPMLKMFAGIEGYPVGPTFQIAVAITAYFVANREIHKANAFNFEPVKEVGLLFVGIFATMAPALGFLAAHGSSLGLNSPTAYYFGTGGLSGVLDNAPTYLNFLQVSFGDQPINSETVKTYLSDDAGTQALIAISLGAVFFGAMTYIGNGPNFMVRAIAEASGLKMPSFFGYLLRSVVLLAPVLVVIWAIFIR